MTWLFSIGMIMTVVGFFSCGFAVGVNAERRRASLDSQQEGT